MNFATIGPVIYSSICPAFCGGNNRHQTYFTTPDEQVSTDNLVRLMDALIEKPDLQKSG